MKNIELGGNEVICQKWEESERGWGTRPDGFSLHLSFSALSKYVQSYWDTMPDDTPDEYSKPDGTAYPVSVDDVTYRAIEQSDGGIRYYSEIEYPGSAGIDGWQPA